MSDKYSVDDILNELSSKKKPRAPKTPTVLDGVTEEIKLGVSDDNDSLTAELAEIEKKRFGASKPKTASASSTPKTSKKKEDLSVTQIINSIPVKTDKPKKKRPAMSFTAPIPDAQDTADLLDSIKDGAKPATIQRFKPSQTSEIADFTPDFLRRETERETEKEAPFVNKILDTDKIFPDFPELEMFSETEEFFEENRTPLEVSPKKPETSKSASKTSGKQGGALNPALIGSHKNKPTYLLPEEKERLQRKREEELLQKDLALEAPHELIDGLNPYDVKKIETPSHSEIIGIKVTRDLSSTNEPVSGEFDYLEDGTTSDGIELLPSTPAERHVEVIKEYSPSKPSAPLPSMKHYKNDVGDGTKVMGDYKDKLGSSALLERLNSDFRRKRESDANARKTISLDTLSSVPGDGNYKGRTLPAQLNIDYKNQIIQESSALPHPDLMIRQAQANELTKKKKRKIRDFILEDISEDYDDANDYEDDDVAEEYESYDSSATIRRDLDETRNGLLWRSALLILLTGFAAIFTFLYEAGSGNKIHAHIRDIWFGGEAAAFANAYIFANLIAGTFGALICSGVVLNGLKCFFTGKSECDSICAVPFVISIITAAVQLSGTSLLQQGKAHVYVSVALFGLLFNSIGKLVMIERAKRNFRFISGDSVKYTAQISDAGDDLETSSVFTKGVVSDIPRPVFLRKTEFLTDFLANSYCEDMADLICRKLAPIGIGLGVILTLAAYFIPIKDPNMLEAQKNICWAVTAGTAALTLLSPFSIIFLVNGPLSRASKVLSKSDSVVMGYKAARRFSRANAVAVDASLLFPPGSVRFLNVKRCQKPGTLNAVSIDESIVIAASLAIKSDSIMSSMFYDMISGDKDILFKIENCIYEVNLGITGWMGTKRIMLGNRKQMEHHGIDVPERAKELKYIPKEKKETVDVVYLAVGGETTAMFFIEPVANHSIKIALQELERNDVALVVKTKDSIVTAGTLSKIYDLDGSKIRILPFDLHAKFDERSKYTSRGSSEIACNGTFTSLARALICAKTMIRDMTTTSAALFIAAFLAGSLVTFFSLFLFPNMISATLVIIYNSIWLGVVWLLQALRRY